MINTLIKQVPEENHSGLRKIDLLVMRPSINLGELAGEHELEVPTGLRFLLRGIGTRDTKSPDFLSMLLFEREYLTRLIEIGEHDAEARMPEIRALAAG